MSLNLYDKWKCHFLDHFQKWAFGKIPHWNLIMKLTMLKGHRILLLNQVRHNLSFAIQYSSIKIIDLILPTRLLCFQRVNLRISRVFDLYKWYSKYFSSPPLDLFAGDRIIHFEIQSQDDHLNKNLPSIANYCRDCVMDFTCRKHNCLTIAIKIMSWNAVCGFIFQKMLVFKLPLKSWITHILQNVSSRR